MISVKKSIPTRLSTKHQEVLVHWETELAVSTSSLTTATNTVNTAAAAYTTRG
jgi:hypothetical protein